MAWWLWVLLGLALAALEAVIGGELWLVLIGCAAILVGGLAALGVVDGVAAQFIAFSGLGVGVFFLKRRIRFNGDSPPVGSEGLAGEIGTVTSEIGSNENGSAEFRGVPWTARSADGTPIEAGSNVRVVRVEGVTLWVEIDN